jgi:hypothetical protein
MIRSKKRQIDQIELDLGEGPPLWRVSGLFSDYYLKSQLKNCSWWPTDEAAADIWKDCAAVIKENVQWLSETDTSEQDCRQELIDRILSYLGYAWSDNIRMPLPRQDMEPDYFLYATDKDKAAALRRGRSGRFTAAISILEAKKYGLELSRRSTQSERYPHQQIRDYLQEAQSFGWGILTNGRLWRLYCRDARPSEFLEVNLEVAIQDLESFKLFLALFSPDAIVQDSSTRCRLDYARESSTLAQTQLEDDMRHRVFGIIEILARGFTENPTNDGASENLQRLYDNCLILLYRLLFLLYAESRRLLPIEPMTGGYYRKLSLSRLQPLLRDQAEFGSLTQTRLYHELKELFHIINGSDESANSEFRVPRYNGGLFDPSVHPDLEKWSICDSALADVLRGLFFGAASGPGQLGPLGILESVNYAGLSVRQLGSIYEGLLEHHLVREDNRIVLASAKHDRRVSATYYTPAHIVKYIVDSAIGPLLDSLEGMPTIAQGVPDSFANAALGLCICDPAMGSGHFLVEAASYIAERIAFHSTTSPKTNSTSDEVQEMEEIQYWRRKVVECCVFGVDVNPLAVELSKLSLWLTTLSSHQPLNFLDHHLRCGNSLIGARLASIGNLGHARKRKASEGDQLSIDFSLDLHNSISRALMEIAVIESAGSEDLASVKEKERRWTIEILPELACFKAVADLWTSTYFGAPLDEFKYLEKAKSALGGDVDQDVGALASEKRFFHWELEFPEVFFNGDGSYKEIPGFNAIIGNPPYDVISEREQAKEVEKEKSFYKSQGHLHPALGGKLNLYRLFMAQAMSLLADDGVHSFIVPMNVLADEQSRRIRVRILNGWRLVVVEAFPQKDDPHNRVFPEAKLPTCIYVIRKSSPSRFVVRAHPGRLILQSSRTIELDHDDVAAIDPANLGIPAEPSMSPESIRLVIDLRKRNPSILKDFAQSRQGEVNLTEHSRFLSTKPQGPLVLRGAHIDRYLLRSNAKQGVPLYLDKSGFLEGRGPDTRAHDHRFPRIGYQSCAALDNWRRIIAAYIEEGEFCTYTINYIVNPRQLSLYAVLALLNSSLWEWRFRLISSNNHVNPYVIDSMPIPDLYFSATMEERETAAQSLMEEYSKCLTQGYTDTFFTWTKRNILDSKKELVFEVLAFLAKRITSLRIEKEAEAASFQSDLLDFYSIDVAHLKPAGVLSEYWKLEPSGLFAHLRDNTKSSAMTGLSLEDEAKIRVRFQESKTKQISMSQEVGFADRLIDKIVFDIYGLTSEEVALVLRGLA